jgi:hypothetical protein
MKYAFRALSCALMLAAACALAGVTVLAVGTALVLAFMAGGRWAVVADVGVLGILAAAGVGLLAARRRRRRRRRMLLVGVPVTSFEQPLLWVEIYRVAEGLGTRAPDELSLVPDANVTASQHRTWLGLRPGARRLRLGLPLLAGLTERQLRAVITYEFSRRWGPALPGRVIDRVRQIIGPLVDLPGEDSRVAGIFRRLGGVYLAVSGPVSARHELEADRLSAELAGNDATEAALRELPVLRRGWDVFVNAYVEPAATVGRRPRDVLGGFASFLQEPARRAQLEAEVAAPASEQPWPHDSQLSLSERLDVVTSLPEDDMHDRCRPAMDLVRDAKKVIRHVEESMFGDSGLAPAAWEDVVPSAARAAACQDALQLARLGCEGGLGPTLSVATLVDLMSFGLAEEMVRPMCAEGASQEAQLQMAGRLVTGFLATAALESGTASYRFSWAAPRLLVDDQRAVDPLPRLVESALADQSEVPALELWLESHRVDRELELGADLGQDVQGYLPDDRAESSDESPAESPAAGPAESPSESPSEDTLDGPRPSLVPDPWIPSV